MIPAHVELYSALSVPQAQLLASRLLRHGLVSPDQVAEPESITGPTVASWCAGLSHAQVVLCLAQETSELGLETIETLLAKPIYMCARGETGDPAILALTDVEGRPLPLPVGRRRGLAQEIERTDRVVPQVPRRPSLRRGTRDPRVILSVVPNPKRPTSDAYVRFARYVVGMSVEDALASGVRQVDLAYDESRGFVVLGLPEQGR